MEHLGNVHALGCCGWGISEGRQRFSRPCLIERVLVVFDVHGFPAAALALALMHAVEHSMRLAIFRREQLEQVPERALHVQECDHAHHKPGNS